MTYEEMVAMPLHSAVKIRPISATEIRTNERIIIRVPNGWLYHIYENIVIPGIFVPEVPIPKVKTEPSEISLTENL